MISSRTSPFTSTASLKPSGSRSTSAGSLHCTPKQMDRQMSHTCRFNCTRQLQDQNFSWTAPKLSSTRNTIVVVVFRMSLSKTSSLCLKSSCLIPALYQQLSRGTSQGSLQLGQVIRSGVASGAPQGSPCPEHSLESCSTTPRCFLNTTHDSERTIVPRDNCSSFVVFTLQNAT